MGPASDGISFLVIGLAIQLGLVGLGAGFAGGEARCQRHVDGPTHLFHGEDLESILRGLVELLADDGAKIHICGAAEPNRRAVIPSARVAATWCVFSVMKIHWASVALAPSRAMAISKTRRSGFRAPACAESVT